VESANCICLLHSFCLLCHCYCCCCNAPQIHPNLVGAASIIQDDQNDFKLTELARWALPSIPNAQYVIQPYQANPPHRFNISQGRVTHRLRWCGSSDASQLHFDSYAADGTLLQSWTGAGGTNCFRCVALSALQHHPPLSPKLVIIHMFCSTAVGQVQQQAGPGMLVAIGMLRYAEMNSSTWPVVHTAYLGLAQQQFGSLLLLLPLPAGLCPAAGCVLLHDAASA
jgi:hypothetical protein